MNLQVIKADNRFQNYLNKYLHYESSNGWHSEIKIEDIKKIGGVMIAGGFVRDFFLQNKPNDMDFYFKTEEVKKSFSQLVHTNIVVENNNADSYLWTVPLQVIKVYYLPIVELLSKFDFTITQCLYDFDTDMFHMHENFFKDLAIKQLIFNNSDFPLASVRRMIKYINRGFRICDENLINMLKAVQIKVPLTFLPEGWEKKEDLKEALKESMGNNDTMEMVSEILTNQIVGLDPNGEDRIYGID